MTGIGPINPSVGATGPSGVGAVTLLDVTLVGGTKTQASGADLSVAKIVGVYLKTATTAVGSPVASISANNVIVTSYAAGAVQAVTDASTYTVALVGVT